MLEQNKLRILAVEDNPADFRLLKEFLSENSAVDFELIHADTLKDALGALLAKNFDVVLLDLNLPDGKGLENIDRIYNSNQRVPVIVFTGIDDERKGIYALQKGAQDYLVKGKIQSDSLIRSIRYAIERKRVEDALRRSEETLVLERNRLKAIIENTPVGIAVTDEKGENVHSNVVFESIWGANRSQMNDVSDYKKYKAWFADTGKPILPEEWASAKVIRTGKPFINQVLEIKRFDGKRAFIINSAAPIFDLEGKIAGSVVAITDITERKELENLLQQKSKEQQTILDSVPAMVFYKDKENRFIRVNKVFEEAMGLAKNKIEGQSLFDLYPKEQAEGYLKDDLEVIKSGKPKRNITEPLQTPQGQRLILVDKVPYLDAEGNVVGVIGFAIDITERKAAEEVLMRDKETFEKLVSEKTRELIKVQLELEQTKRLSDIGTLAATVAHELRNPLAAIKMAAYNAQRKAQNPILDKHFSNIEIKLHESENIIDNLLFYSKIRTPHCAPINLHNIISACIKDTKARFPEYKISIVRKDSSIRDLLVEADAVQVREIFANLLNNSFDAIGQKGGRIEIKTQVDDQDVLIAIKDNGVGIDKENLERIFQAFFSTKAKGTGLGLTVAQQVVKLHGGLIDLESQKGKGTTVTVKLPLKHKPNA